MPAPTTIPLWLSALLVVGVPTAIAMFGPYFVRRLVPLKAAFSPFVPDGVYGGIPYRVLSSGSIDAMMPGGVVRFRNVEQLVAAAGGSQKPVDVPPPSDRNKTLGPAERPGRSKRLIVVSALSVLILTVLFAVLNRPVQPGMAVDA